MKILTEAFNSVTIKKGESFAIALESNPSTGYMWDLQVTSGDATLWHKDLEAGSNFGGSCREVFMYQADKAGTVEIDANYQRPWEKNAPAKSQQFKITVE